MVLKYRNRKNCMLSGKNNNAIAYEYANVIAYFFMKSEQTMYSFPNECDELSCK